MTRRPTFTFVATSRNDDHGGDVLRRTQSFINRLAEQCERHEVSAELIMVEWNPPVPRASLADVLGWPRGSKWFTARMMTVPRPLHLTLAYSSRLSLFQMIGKNVGIRRAAGDYVIATNIDIVFSDELFVWLKNGGFRDGVLYRSDRWDIPNTVQLEPDLDVLLDRARGETIRRNRKEGTFVKRDGKFVNSTPDRFDDAFYNALEHHLNRFRDALSRADASSHAMLLAEYEALLSEELPRLRRNYLIPLLHTNGCGDFTMLSRDDWFRLRGYPEWNIFSWTIDSVLLFQAHYNGMEIEELDERCVHYHIEHDYGSGWTPEGAGSLWTRMEERGIPYMSYRQFTEVVHELQDNAKENMFTVYNGLDWGLFGRGVEIADIVAEGTPPRPPLTANTAPLDENFLGGLMPLELGSPYEVFSAVPGAELAVAPGSGEDAAELSIETRPERWSYAAEFELGPLAEQAGEYWLVMEVAVDAGEIGIALLNAAKDDFVAERTMAAGGGWRQVIHAVRDAETVSQLIFRNIGADGACRLRLRNFRVLADWVVEEPPRADGAAPGTGGKSAHGIDPAPAGIDRERDAAVVRRLGDPAASDGDGAEGRFLAVLPPGSAEWKAVAALRQGGEGKRLALDLHVIEGRAGVGIRAQGGEPTVIEEVDETTGPFARVELDLADSGEGASLAVRNLSAEAATKVLIHGLTYRTAKPAGAAVFTGTGPFDAAAAAGE